MQSIQIEVDQLLAQKKYQKALKKVKGWQKKQPKSEEYVRLEGIVHLHQRRLLLAEKCFKKALNMKPDYVNAMSNLAFIYYANKKHNKAASVLKKAIEIKPDDIESNNQLAHVATALKDWTLAERQHRKTLAIEPRHMESLVNLAMLLKNNGDIEQATIFFRKALDINPFQPEIYWTLANLKTYTFSKEEKLIVEQMIEKTSDYKKLSALYFTKARYLEDDGNYEESFNALKQGNAIKFNSFKKQETDWDKLLCDIKAVFTPEFVEDNQCQKECESLPVLIAGMPRSGSTLIEQILASHSKITGASELEYLGEWIEQQEKDIGRSYPSVFSSGGKIVFEQLSQNYQQLTKLWWDESKCFTDKNPANILYVGAFLMAFPKAKVIHSKRNAMDVCLSAFKQNFEKGNEYSFNLHELVAYYKFQESLADLWKSLFPTQVISVEYESVLADIKAETIRILDFLGFDYEEACLRFYETKRSIRTASAGQVTQKLYQSANQHFKKYGDSLTELAKLLEYDHG
ncbi:tetratricopeptide repeat-containing sulfotransferase family protein [Marinicella rhabdoformis]|uniref:tetratricopeptide repeat-containing sulfotransferase family protein n=1 Tax=Marinicella rhabdoformis TaxID=2580566 RepID=UPI0012AEB346|nr:sulfotransferase [Marinicella rhabdoformis]